MRRPLVRRLAALAAALWAAHLLAQAPNNFPPRDHPAIRYSTQATTDAIARVAQRLRSGALRLTYDKPQGYLRTILATLDIPISSQTLVFSATSLQSDLIAPSTPRALYFNDSVAVGWVKGAETLEIAAHDPAQGVVFYQLSQSPRQAPQFVRGAECLACHLAAETSGVPGLVTMSVLPLSDNKFEYAQGWPTDHRTPFEDRWGGWYVTGLQVPARHLGNVPVNHVPRSYVRAAAAPKLTTAAEAFDARAYVSPHSDVVALMVLNHQVQAINLLTALGWEARIAALDSPPAKRGGPTARVRDLARELVDYLLFVDEAPFTSPVKGSSAFAQEFAAKGRRDGKGRSLRDFNLTSRLFRYPCSYMIYADAFDALPAGAKTLVYERLWEILSGKETGSVYAKLTGVDRRAIVEILRATKRDLPAYFAAPPP
jgi:hypothetical protein